MGVLVFKEPAGDRAIHRGLVRRRRRSGCQLFNQVVGSEIERFQG
jgi:hypothetical protein